MKYSKNLFLLIVPIILCSCESENQPSNASSSEKESEVSQQPVQNENEVGTEEEVETVSDVTTDNLLKAIEQEDIEKINKLIKSGVDVNAQPNWDSKTPLIIAVESGNLETVKILVENGAEIEKGTNEFLEHTNPVTSAIQHGQLKILKYFVTQGVDVNYWSPVWYINLEDSKMTNYLMKNGMDLNAIYAIDAEYEVSRLAFALMNNDNKMVKFLISNGADIDKSALFSLKSEDQFRLLKELGFDFSSATDQISETTGDPSINSILSFKNKKIVKHYLKHGLNPTPNTIVTLFRYNQLTNEKEIFEITLQYKIKNDSNFDINSVYEFHKWIIYPFLSETVPDNQTTLLNLAVIGGYKEATKILLQYGADPQVKDGHSKSALDYAQKNEEILKILQ